MLIIIDQKIPQEAKNRLSDFGELFLLESKNIVYSAISGHPDIFIFQMDNHLICSPNSPSNLIHKLKTLQES